MKLKRQKQIALGSEAVITLVTDLPEAQISALYAELWLRIVAFEKSFSRFLPTSELSMFNRLAGAKQPVSQEFHDILQAARKLSLETDGLYNPFVLPALQRAGYTRSFVKGAEHDVHDDHSRKGVATINKLELGNDWARIPYGTALDLGGCGKGYLADQLAEYIEPEVAGYSISLGGDLVCGGLDDKGANFSVTIQAANRNDDAIIGEIIMPPTRYAVASSGTTIRKGVNNGKPWHHIIDPTTMKPAQTNVQLATICQQSCLYADVLASCCVILGTVKSQAFLKQHHVTDALFQMADKSGQTSVAQIGKRIQMITA